VELFLETSDEIPTSGISLQSGAHGQVQMRTLFNYLISRYRHNFCGYRHNLFNF